MSFIIFYILAEFSSRSIISRKCLTFFTIKQQQERTKNKFNWRILFVIASQSNSNHQAKETLKSSIIQIIFRKCLIFDCLLTNNFFCFSNILKLQKLLFILSIFFIFIRHCYLQNLIDFENITNRIIDDFTSSKSFLKMIKTLEQQKLRQHRSIDDVFALFIKIHTNRRNKKSIDQLEIRHKSLSRHQKNLSKDNNQVEEFTQSSSSIVLRNSL